MKDIIHSVFQVIVCGDPNPKLQQHYQLWPVQRETS